MTLNPPAHICGPMRFTDTDRLRERAEWINSLPETYNLRQIAHALGVCRHTVSSAAPGRFTRVASSVSAPQGVAVSLPPLPFEIERCDRTQTAPRAGVMSPPRRDAGTHPAIAAIRELHAEWVAA